MFKNRIEAGQLLGKKILEEIKGEKPGLSFVPIKSGLQTAGKPGFDELIVLGIPRGGVIVAAEVAKILSCPLDIIVVRKIGAPNESELAVGAIGEPKGAKYINEKLAVELGADKGYLDQEIKIQILEIKRRERVYRQGREALDLKDKTVIVVDDGTATGATAIAALREVWNNNPKKVILALPVVAQDTLEKLTKEADEVIFLEKPWPFFSVGQFYEEFEQVSDEEVIDLLNYK